VILKGLENGAYKASAYRDQECPNEPLDAGFAASILRFHSSRLIKTIGSDFQLEDWIEDSMPFMGMSFYYRKNHVRILKGPNGELPGCSDSDKKKRFYNQLPSLYLIGTETHKVGMQRHCVMELRSELHPGNRYGLPCRPGALLALRMFQPIGMR
jgi:hypothetical protein